MTLEEKAERHSKNYAFTICLHNGRVRKSGKQIAIENYIAGAKELEQENNKLLDVINGQDVKIADLEQQIEKMKRCEIPTFDKE